MGKLILRDIHKSYGKDEVLHGINIETGENQFLVLIGPSGCGKTTLLNIIAGLEQESGGDILLNDRRLNDQSPKDRDIATEFDPIALETGGPAWYRDVFVKLDAKAIDSPTMVKALERLRQIEAYTPKSLAGRTWNYDTGLVAHGQAAFQIMGDWANGQFEFLGVEPGGPKVGCVAFPGTASDFIYNVDSFIFFRQHTAAAREATIKLAETMTSPKFQLLFNKYKGSIPDLMNVSLKGYNPCQLKSRAQFLTASKEHNLVPSFSQDMSTYGPPTGAFTDSLDHFYTTNESPQAAAAAMAKRVEVAKSQD